MLRYLQWRHVDTLARILNYILLPSENVVVHLNTIRFTHAIILMAKINFTFQLSWKMYYISLF